MHATQLKLKRAHLRAIEFAKPLAALFELTPARFDVMYVIKNSRSKFVCQKEICEVLGLSAPTISKILDRMAERGLVTKDRYINDGRFSDVRLTTHGFACIAAAIHAFLRLEGLRPAYDRAHDADADAVDFAHADPSSLLALIGPSEARAANDALVAYDADHPRAEPDARPGGDEVPEAGTEAGGGDVAEPDAGPRGRELAEPDAQAGGGDVAEPDAEARGHAVARHDAVPGGPQASEHGAEAGGGDVTEPDEGIGGREVAEPDAGPRGRERAEPGAEAGGGDVAGHDEGSDDCGASVHREGERGPSGDRTAARAFIAETTRSVARIARNFADLSSIAYPTDAMDAADAARDLDADIAAHARNVAREEGIAESVRRAAQWDAERRPTEPRDPRDYSADMLPDAEDDDEPPRAAQPARGATTPSAAPELPRGPRQLLLPPGPTRAQPPLLLPPGPKAPLLLPPGPVSAKPPAAPSSASVLGRPA